MKKAVLFAVLFLAVIIYSSSATATSIMMIQVPIEQCVEFRDVDRISSCIRTAPPPESLSACDKIPQEIEGYDELLLICYEKYAKAKGDSSACSKLLAGQESIDNCYAYGFFCDELNDAGRKSECEQKKFNTGMQQIFGSISTAIIFLLYFGIPIVILLFIIKTIIDVLRKGKSTKKPIKRDIAIIIVLAIIWFLLANIACLPPVCYIFY